jgi:hypothetical protein
MAMMNPNESQSSFYGKALLPAEAMSMADPKYLRDGFDFCLSHAIEECGEFLAAAGKLQRWGLDSVNPELPAHQQETNLAWLIRELHDVQDAMSRLRRSLVLDYCGMDDADDARSSPASGETK